MFSINAWGHVPSAEGHLAVNPVTYKRLTKGLKQLHRLAFGQVLWSQQSPPINSKINHKKTNIEVFFCPMIPEIRHSLAFFF